MTQLSRVTLRCGYVMPQRAGSLEEKVVFATAVFREDGFDIEALPEGARWEGYWHFGDDKPSTDPTEALRSVMARYMVTQAEATHKYIIGSVTTRTSLPSFGGPVMRWAFSDMSLQDISNKYGTGEYWPSTGPTPQEARQPADKTPWQKGDTDRE